MDLFGRSPIPIPGVKTSGSYFDFTGSNPEKMCEHARFQRINANKDQQKYPMIIKKSW